ncbi:MAG TPA: carboxylating nicotinate-nucleotide diphosphorylase [Rhodothermales bacterium]|nr:carboxylating nicotinate-nucleotide diphosphorylase [Rhodothermales bacterium]
MLPFYLTLAHIDDLVARALDEDIGTGDVTSLATIPEPTTAEATFLAKADGVLAGLLVAEHVFAAVDADLEVHWLKQDGEQVSAGTRFGTVAGRARSILQAERLALNLMQRMSGIATATHHMVEATGSHPARILDTRKTAPGLRLLDKWAVRLGGGENHRIGLYDMILIKDNHIAAVGGVRAAIEAARHYRKQTDQDLRIEIETRTLNELQTVLDVGGVDVVLLDNMVQVTHGKVDTSLLAQAVEMVAGRFATEASGNVTLQTVPAIAATGVDYISSGALTHSVKALDISLKVDLNPA